MKDSSKLKSMRSPERVEADKIRARIRAMSAIITQQDEAGREEALLLTASDYHPIGNGAQQILCSLSGLDDLTVANVVLQAGGRISKHRHDRAESIYLLWGDFTELGSGRKMKAGDQMQIPAMQYHGGFSETGALLTTTWHPPFADHRPVRFVKPSGTAEKLLALFAGLWQSLTMIR
jgi:quercetin dioxygenase-like cupin family protein